MQAASANGQRQYDSALKAFIDIYRKEGGITGLYRGIFPTTVRAGVLTASQLATYDHIKTYLRDGYQVREGINLHIMSSMIAGFVCAATTAPFDTIKSRYMHQAYDAKGRGVSYNSAWDCLRKTVVVEGPQAVYKGFMMNWYDVVYRLIRWPMLQFANDMHSLGFVLDRIQCYRWWR